MNCPNCGQDNPAEARFCGACGSTLGATAAPAPPRVPRAAAAEYAGFWMRLVAWFIDLIIILIGTAALLKGLASLPYGDLVGYGDLLSLVFPVLYFILLTGLRGQTVGKMALGIKVVRDNGQGTGTGLRRSAGDRGQDSISDCPVPGLPLDSVGSKEEGLARLYCRHPCRKNPAINRRDRPLTNPGLFPNREVTDAMP